MPSIFMRDKPILSSERMLHKDYYRRSSVEKKSSGRVSQGAWRQDELIGGKPPVVSNSDFDFDFKVIRQSVVDWRSE
jgi:hypothetical protein